MSRPVEFVTWILSPRTEVNFKITIKFPFGWCCGGCCGRCCGRGNNGYCIVWKNYTCTNCKCDVIYGYITLVTLSSDAFKYNLIHTQKNNICKNRVAASVSLSYVWDWVLHLNRYQVLLSFTKFIFDLQNHTFWILHIWQQKKHLELSWLIIWTSSFPDTSTPNIWLKISRDKYIFLDKHDRGFVSRTTITPKFKMCWFPNQACYEAEKLYTDINLNPLCIQQLKPFWILEFDEVTWKWSIALTVISSQSI